jgi:hypothetical protein
MAPWTDSRILKLSERVDVLRDDVNASVEELGDRPPLLGKRAPQARGIFGHDHLELFRTGRRQQ